MHASDDARLVREARSASTVRPGSLEEAEALMMIDQARYEELAARDDTSARRARRARKHWAGRGAQLGETW